jgi:magnesium-protoporphyrin O-methyltransferase
MDSLIHYPVDEVARALQALAARTRQRMLFTFAPRTMMLSAMHAVGQWFPRGDRSPAIEPVSQAALAGAIAACSGLTDWTFEPRVRIASGFYISQVASLARRSTCGTLS